MHFPTVPLPIPIPRRLVLFSPHPDDISISMGALAALAARLQIPVTIALVTDGSEARLPESFLRLHGWTPTLTPEAQRDLRGRIRVAEAVEEARRLGIDAASVVLLRRQHWFTSHRTPAAAMHDDLSLRDVSEFQPGEMDDDAEAEIRDIIGDGVDIICAAPDANDRLMMHRITTVLLRSALGKARMLTYECLSTISVSGAQTALPFGDELMDIKRHAIGAHESMRARRVAFGGYSNPGSEFYDEICARRCAELARTLQLEEPYAERYGWQ